MQNTIALIRTFILDNFYIPEGDAVANDTSLINGGYIDSTGVLEVTAFLEREFGLSIADDEITPENLDTIERMATFVCRKERAA